MNNPYIAPTASVADAPAEMPATPPRQVLLACRVLWGSLVLSFLPQYSEIRDDFLKAKSLFSADVFLDFVGIFLICGLMAVLIVSISRGLNWARWTLLIAEVVGLLFSIADFQSMQAKGTFALSIDILTAAADIFACYLLFFTDGRKWFQKR